MKTKFIKACALAAVAAMALTACGGNSSGENGGSASAPIIATAYDGSFAGIGVLMGVLGAAIGNFLGLGMGALLQMFV